MNSIIKPSLIALSSLATLITIVACSHTYQDPNEYHAKPSKDMALITNVELSKLNEGHAIYKRQCSKCHDPRLPGAVASKKWHKVIPKMSINAGLTKAEEKTLHTYIISASRFIEMEYEH